VEAIAFVRGVVQEVLKLRTDLISKFIIIP
jgi:hypothetical protein